MTFSRHRIGLFATIAAISLAASSSALAVGTDTPAPPAEKSSAPAKSNAKPADKAGDKKAGDAKASDTKASDTKASDTKTEDKPAEPKAEPEKKSQRDFLEGYRHAYNLIYKRQDYAAGISALRALGHDEHPDVANLVGFSSRKLGRTDDAKVWYEKALAADPKHTRTWQYYGMWHLEQGNRLKAEEHLEKIQLICGGTSCEDYQSLRKALDGNMTY